MKEPNRRRFLSLWLKWTLWLAIGWTMALVIEESWLIPSMGYPRWFLFEAVATAPAILFEVIVTAIVSAVITGLVALLERGNFADDNWGARTPFSIGLAWSLGAGVVLGLVMMYSQKVQQHG